MALKLNSSGGGSVTLDAPSTASAYTLTVPALSGSFVTADANGNVGIGTTSPTNKLHVANGNFFLQNAIDITPSATWGGQLTVNGNGYSGGFSFDGTAMWVGHNSNDRSLILATNETARVTISGTGATSIAGDLSFNSGYGSAVVAYGCRAWVNFNGTGTVAIRTSGNVGSITDLGVGQYQINFSSAMVDANYAVTAISGNGGYGTTAGSFTTSSCVVKSYSASAGFGDNNPFSVAIFR